MTAVLSALSLVAVYFLFSVGWNYYKNEGRLDLKRFEKTRMVTTLAVFAILVFGAFVIFLMLISNPFFLFLLIAGLIVYHRHIKRRS